MLNRVREEDIVFWGHLRNEKTSVAVTIQDASNPDDLEVLYPRKFNNPSKKVLIFFKFASLFFYLYYSVFVLLIGCNA